RDKQDAIGRLVGGDQDAATRTTDFTGTRKYYVPIPLWIDDTKKALPLSVLSHEINFEVTWAVLNELVQSDGTPNPSSPGITASSQKLRIFHVHVPSDEQAYLQQMSD